MFKYSEFAVSLWKKIEEYGNINDFNWQYNCRFLWNVLEKQRCVENLYRGGGNSAFISDKYKRNLVERVDTLRNDSSFVDVTPFSSNFHGRYNFKPTQKQ